MSLDTSAPILVVDDDPKIVSLVRTYLERDGFRVTTASDGRAALEAMETAPPRLIVLDIMLPELDGMAVLHRLREHSTVPVVMLSARGSAADRVYGISEGADDYLAKPFSPAELVVRVKAVLRRTAPPSAGRTHPVVLDDLAIDLDRLEVRRGADRIALTSAEFRLIAALALAAGRVLTRQALLDALSDHAQGDGLERTVDVHVGRLRSKLGDSPTHPRYVVTVRGAGYRAGGP